jgi:hypothetical protein
VAVRSSSCTASTLTAEQLQARWCPRPHYGAIDLGKWRFWFGWGIVDPDGELTIVGEVFSQNEDIDTRAKIDELLIANEVPDAIQIRADNADPKMIEELNAALDRRSSKYFVSAVEAKRRSRTPASCASSRCSTASAFCSCARSWRGPGVAAGHERREAGQARRRLAAHLGDEQLAVPEARRREDPEGRAGRCDGGRRRRVRRRAVHGDDVARAARGQADIARYRETIAQLRIQNEQLEQRADFAETTVQGLTTANGALWGQNERLLSIVAEMRRAGFELVRPDTEPNDQVRTIEQDDADALKGDKTLIATSDD